MCGGAFSRMKTLTEHIRVIHEGRKDHCCEHCGKAFGTRKNMLDHVKMVHDKIRDKICRFVQIIKKTNMSEHCVLPV